MIRWITPTLGTGAFTRVQNDGTFVVVDVRVLLDKRGNPPALVRAKIDEAGELLRAGRRVVICCDYGMSRSNAIAAGALSVVGEIPIERAIEIVRAATGELAIQIEVLGSVREALASAVSTTRSPSQRIVVTGGNGYLGRALVSRLGPHVVAPSRASLDLARCAGELDALLDGGAHSVVHLAAPRIYTTNAAFGEILTMQKCVVDACLRNDVALVVVSSWNVYAGYRGEIVAGEQTPLHPSGTYGHAKALCEDLLVRLRRDDGLRCTMLRCGPIFGLGNTQPRFIYNFIDKALSNDEIVTHSYPDGDPCLDLVWAEEFVGALSHAITSRSDGDFNIGGRSLVSTRTVAERIVALTSSSSPIRATQMLGHATRVKLDSSRAAKALGYEARMSLDDGLAAIIAERRNSHV